MKDLSKELFDLYMQLPRRFKRLLGGSLEEVVLGLTDIKILDELSRIGPCKMSDLAESLVVTMGGLTPHVDRLVEKGYVRRFKDEERDRRLVLVEVTPEGQEVLANSKECFLKVLSNRLEELSPTQRDKLLDAIRVIRESLKF
ncbi:MarR family transcriptional regulator [Coprothermobacteraceae bacterium]|nr:MarR family transcriptional regulator [Coprothermobacteraceae bacterium]